MPLWAIFMLFQAPASVISQNNGKGKRTLFPKTQNPYNPVFHLPTTFQHSAECWNVVASRLTPSSSILKFSRTPE